MLVLPLKGVSVTAPVNVNWNSVVKHELCNTREANGCVNQCRLILGLFYLQTRFQSRSLYGKHLPLYQVALTPVLWCKKPWCKAESFFVKGANWTRPCAIVTVIGAYTQADWLCPLSSWFATSQLTHKALAEIGTCRTHQGTWAESTQKSQLSGGGRSVPRRCSWLLNSIIKCENICMGSYHISAHVTRVLTSAWWLRDRFLVNHFKLVIDRLEPLPRLFISVCPFPLPPLSSLSPFSPPLRAQIFICHRYAYAVDGDPFFVRHRQEGISLSAWQPTALK